VLLENENLARIRGHMREHALKLTGAPSTGMEIAGMIRILANLYENHRMECSDGAEISGPRMGILFRLMAEEDRGNTAGITPSEFSRNQNVSRNTISALLRGLEEQGLIERRLDEQDRRVFRIGVTQAGRDVVAQLGPKMVKDSSQMVSGLADAEQAQLVELLGKLFISLKHNAGCENENSLKE
jgi:DNA-binding MarR family transcriptional regulator